MSNLDQQVDAVYGQLKQLARSKLRYERRHHSFNTTGLVHEAYIKLSKDQHAEYQDQGHFMALAAQAMRRILIDHARSLQREKRGGKHFHITHDDESIYLETTPEELLALNEAMQRLEALNPRQAKVVECWFFGGYSHEEISNILDTSIPTVRRDWRLARVWLSKELKEAGKSPLISL